MHRSKGFYGIGFPFAIRPVRLQVGWLPAAQFYYYSSSTYTSRSRASVRSCGRHSYLSCPRTHPSVLSSCCPPKPNDVPTVVPAAGDSWSQLSHTVYTESADMAALLTLASCVVGLLAAIGVGLGLVLLFFPELKKWPANFIQQHLFPDANQILLNQGKATANGAQRNVYRVLAFGDSLTEGFTSGGVNFHPYVKRLGDKLYAGMPQGWHLEVEEQGESGERVLISMKHRLQRTLDEHAAAGRHYDWVLLLGGINDLGGDQSTAEEVLQGLAVLTEACLTHGANVLLMTVMEVAQPEPAIEKQRQQLNTLIQQYAQGSKWTAAAQAALQSPGTDGNSSSSSSRSPVARRGPPRVVLYDLARELTWSEMSEEQRWENWDDGVHLTVDGYDLMGELISAALRPLVVQEIGKAAGGGSVHGSAAVVANDGPGRGMHGQSNGITEHKKSL